jgi:hypothetical protein
MSDIVERLRREGVEFHEQLEAAAEIELLTELLRAARGLLQFNNILYPDEIDDALEQKP